MKYNQKIKKIKSKIKRKNKDNRGKIGKNQEGNVSKIQRKNKRGKIKRKNKEENEDVNTTAKTEEN